MNYSIRKLKQIAVPLPVGTTQWDPLKDIRCHSKNLIFTFAYIYTRALIFCSDKFNDYGCLVNSDNNGSLCILYAPLFCNVFKCRSKILLKANEERKFREDKCLLTTRCGPFEEYCTTELMK